jgi:pimeloyl-ACP methyl ester carboxylesterase
MGRVVVIVLVAWLALVAGTGAATDPAIVSVYPAAKPHGLMATSGGWAYCQQVMALARRDGYTLLCGRYALDGYTGYGLRSQRHLDWGNPAYLASLAGAIAREHAKTGGPLLLVGVSYSGFGVATLASHHPELRPSRLIVIDSYLDLVARRAALPATQITAREIDAETGGEPAALQARTVSVAGLAALVRSGTRLSIIWSVSPDEQKEFNGATCGPNADAGVLQQLADRLDSPVDAWVTQSRHGHDLWDLGGRIVAGAMPGREVAFQPGGEIPAAAVCG